MGNNSGVVWNDSDLPIQYCIYGVFEEMGTTKNRRTIKPRIDIQASEGALNIEGFESTRYF